MATLATRIFQDIYDSATFLASIKNMEDKEGKKVSALSRIDPSPLNARASNP
jgi:hypothetical protein